MSSLTGDALAGSGVAAAKASDTLLGLRLSAPGDCTAGM